MDKIRQLGDYRYIVIENVKHLYGKSATAKILAEFVKCMAENDTGVIFTGRRAAVDMAEFMELAEDYIQYVIVVETEE